MLAVVLAAAGIRLGWPGLRVMHRTAASLEVLVVLWLALLAWRTRPRQPALWRAALLAVAISIVLSLIGIATGQNPPPPAAAANLLGGLALTAVFAWILGRSAKKGSVPVPALVLALLIAVQLSLGAWLAVFDRFAAALPAHGLLAVVLVPLIGWFALARLRGGAGKALFALALAAPLAGFTSLQFESSPGAALAHAAAAAALLTACAWTLGRAA